MMQSVLVRYPKTSHVAAIACLCSIAACARNDEGRSITAPSAAPVSTLAALGVDASGLASDIIRASLNLQSEVTALQIAIDDAEGSGSPGIRRLRSAVQAAAGYEFLINQFAKLSDGDHGEQLELLRGALAQLEEFKAKLQQGLTDDTLPDNIRGAAEITLGTSDTLQSLILLAFGCTEFPC